MATYTIKRTLLAITLSVIVIGCVREADQQLLEHDLENLHEVVFHAGWATETKTVLQEEGSVWWSPGDEISLFVGNGANGGYKLTATNTEPAATVDFVGQIGGSGTKYTAIYPYNESNRVEYYDGNGNSIDFAIPTEQIAKEGSFPEGAFVSIAVSSNNQLYFKNLCSGIKFSVANENINRVVIKSRDGSGLAGWVGNIMLNDTGEPATDINGSSSSVSITAPGGDCFKTGAYYYASIIPGTKNEGVEIEYITKEDMVGTVVLDNTISFNRAVVKRLYEKDKDLQFYPYHENKAYLYAHALLPEGVDKAAITNVSFIVNSEKTTDTSIYSPSKPIYFELEGTTAKYYTSAEVYDLRNAFEMFSGWTSLKQIDLSNIETVHVTNMGGMFAGCLSLTSITFGDFHTENVQNMSGMFADCWSLESLDLSTFQTGKVTNMMSMFQGCSSLKTLNLNSFDTSNVEDMSYMFGWTGVAVPNMPYHYICGQTGCSSLENLDLHLFNTSNVTNMGGMFSRCYNLKTVNLGGWDTSRVESFGSMFSECASLESVDLSSFDTQNITWMGHMFESCTSLISLDLSSFKTPNVTSIQNMFYGCESLQTLDIHNFDSSSLTDAMQFLVGAKNLKQLDLGTFDMSKIDIVNEAFYGVANQSQCIAIKCVDATKQVIINQANSPFFNVNYITWIGVSEQFPALPPDYIDPNLYYSSDFSKDKQVQVLQTASTGQGVDIVIMGDAYSDRLIADGTYENDMREAIEAIFSVEPMKSYRDLFNVYVVFAVSANEKYNGATVFHVQPSGDYVGGDVLMSNVYTKIAVPNKQLSDIATIVIGHDTDAFINAQGTTLVSYVSSSDEYYDFGPAAWNVAYVGRFVQGEIYPYTVVHEFGHLFSKLADEYVMYDETIESIEYEIQNLEMLFQHLGVYRNIDFTSDSETIRWNRFLKDSRYSSEKLGAYEGGLLYSRGVWRPSEDSIMRNAWTIFNAPSREAIYNRIHKLAYGDTWQYDFETFVQQDLKNIQQPSPTLTKSGSSPSWADRKSFIKVDKTITPEGKKAITLIMN